MRVGSTAFILVPGYWKVRKPIDLPRVTPFINQRFEFRTSDSDFSKRK